MEKKDQLAEKMPKQKKKDQDRKPETPETKKDSYKTSGDKAKVLKSDKAQQKEGKNDSVKSLSKKEEKKTKSGSANLKVKESARTKQAKPERKVDSSWQAYYNKRLKSVKRRLKEIIKSKDPDAIHQFRVEVKKMAALFRMQSFLKKDFEHAAHLKPLKSLFNYAGDMRDHGNMSALAVMFNVDPAMLAIPSKQKKKAYASLKKEHKDRIKKFRAGEKDLKLKSGFLSLALAKKYLNALAKETLDWCKKDGDAQELHDLRKKVKDMLYLSAWLSDHKLLPITKARIELLDEFQERIGNWHDLELFRLTLENHKDIGAYKKVHTAVKNAEKQSLIAVKNLSGRISRMSAF